jgi:hypothetical protein
LSIGESKSLQNCLQHHIVTAQAAALSAGTAAVRPAAVSCATKESTQSSFAPCLAMSPSPVHASTSPLINSRDRFRHTAYRSLWLKVAQYAVPLVLGLDFINGLLPL